MSSNVLIEIKNQIESFKKKIDKCFNSYMVYLETGRVELHDSLYGIAFILDEAKATLASEPNQLIELYKYVVLKGANLLDDDEFVVDDIVGGTLQNLFITYKKTNNILFLDAYLDLYPYVANYLVCDYEYGIHEYMNEDDARLMLSRMEEKLIVFDDDMLGTISELLEYDERDIENLRARVDFIREEISEQLIKYDNEGDNTSFDHLIKRIKYDASLIDKLCPIAYEHYMRLGNKEGALDSLRELFGYSYNIKYYYQSLELSNEDSEIEYYANHDNLEAVVEIYNSTGSYRKMLDTLITLDNVDKLMEYYDKLKGSYKDNVIRYIYNKIIKIAKNSNDYELLRIPDYINYLINIDSKSSYLYSLGEFIENEAHLSDAEREYFDALKAYLPS